MEELEPETVFHLAAQSSVVVSVENPGRDCEVNVQGTLNVVDAANKRGDPGRVHLDRGRAVRRRGAAADRRAADPKPLSPYGASKLAGESYVGTWARSRRACRTRCAGLGNVYGPRQSPHGEAGVVSIFTHRLHSGQAPKLFGHGQPTRDYVYVGDVVSALLAAAGKAGTFNIATGVETDVMTIWSELRQVAGSDLEPELADLRPGELQHSCLDASLAESELGWRAAGADRRGSAENL